MGSVLDTRESGQIRPVFMVTARQGSGCAVAINTIRRCLTHRQSACDQAIEMGNCLARRHRQDIVTDLAAEDCRKHVDNPPWLTFQPGMQAREGNFMAVDQVLKARMGAAKRLIMGR